ncbi:MAG TPA: YjdF family protein [Rectinemataceae bacterium]|nr:YjdF family protein [Rectinemataceae bacterium]
MFAQFTIYFEGPFWVGVLEVDEDGEFVVARHVFGAEPSNAQLLDFMLHRYHLMRRTHSAAAAAAAGAVRTDERLPGAKRAIREARREMSRGLSTRARSALSSAREASKEERSIRERGAGRAEAVRRFELRSERRAERRRGR